MLVGIARHFTPTATAPKRSVAEKKTVITCPGLSWGRSCYNLCTVGVVVAAVFGLLIPDGDDGTHS
jgi:hypothetical protein